LRFLTNNDSVGQFAAADKIIQAGKVLYQPISQSIYPVFGKNSTQMEIQHQILQSNLPPLLSCGRPSFSNAIYMLIR